MIWSFKRQPSAPEPNNADSKTPIADAVLTMFKAGRASGDIVAAIRVLEVWAELERVRAENLRLRVELNWRAADMPDTQPVSPTRVTKPKVVTRTKATRTRAPKKRNRANYMRDYRNRLKLVTRDGDAA